MINRFVIAILLITTLIVATPSAAFANPPDDINTPPSAEYEREPGAQLGGVLGLIGKLIGSVRSPAIISPPSNVAIIGLCKQRSDNPHKSRHFENTVAGRVWSSCRGGWIVPEMSFTAYLGEGTSIENIRDVHPLNLSARNRHVFHDHNVSEGDAIADTYCRDRWYKTRGHGHVIYRGGGPELIWATASGAVNNPCDL